MSNILSGSASCIIKDIFNEAFGLSIEDFLILHYEN